MEKKFFLPGILIGLGIGIMIIGHKMLWGTAILAVGIVLYKKRKTYNNNNDTNGQ